jgi:hypothetical protein
MKYLLALAFFLVGCEPSEMYPVPVGAGVAGSSGGSYSAPAKTAPTPHAPMLQDPEGQLSDESVTIYAKSLDEAINQCIQTATKRSDPETIVSCLGCKLMTSAKTGRYACTLRIETRKQ